MSESQAIILRPISERPPGVTPKQWRRAQLYERCETDYEACVSAGYSPKTARKNGAAIRAALGTRRAQEHLAATQADRARGFMGASQLALKAVKEDIEALDPRDRLAAAVKFAETAHQLGENIEQRGDADSYHQRLRRAVLFGYRLGAARQRTTQDVVLSPPHNPKSRKKQR